MTPLQLEQVNKIIKESVAFGIDANLNQKMQLLTEKLDDYIKKDEEWKENVTPSIEMMKHIANFSDSTVWLLKTFLLIASTCAAFYAFFRFIRN